MSENACIQNWLDGLIKDVLYVPDGYESHGRRGKQPYRHVVNNEVKVMNFKKVEDPQKKEDKLLYSVIFLDIADIKAYFDVTYPSFKKNYTLRQDEYESCYDWVINECVKKIFSDCGVILVNHCRHDIFKCVYDEIGHMLENNIRDSLVRQNYGFVVGTKVKTMVCGTNLMIARSTNV